MTPLADQFATIFGAPMPPHQVDAQVNAMHALCGGILTTAQETDAQRWLRQNEAAIARIRAEREAEDTRS